MLDTVVCNRVGYIQRQRDPAERRDGLHIVQTTVVGPQLRKKQLGRRGWAFHENKKHTNLPKISQAPM